MSVDLIRRVESSGMITYRAVTDRGESFLKNPVSWGRKGREVVAGCVSLSPVEDQHFSSQAKMSGIGIVKQKPGVTEDHTERRMRESVKRAIVEVLAEVKFKLNHRSEGHMAPTDTFLELWYGDVLMHELQIGHQEGAE